MYEVNSDIQVQPIDEERLIPVIRELGRIFDLFNKRFFSDELPRPVLAIMSGHQKNRGVTRRLDGWCSEEMVWKDKENSTEEYEITICAEHLADGDAVAGTLLHEMVHLYNAIHGIRDTSRSGTFHNAKFLKTATEQGGLKVTKDEKYGYSKTSLDKEALDLLKDNNFHKFSLYRDTPIDEKQMAKVAAKKSSTRKYICPHADCGVSVRATKDVDILCGIHNERFIREEAS